MCCSAYRLPQIISSHQLLDDYVHSFHSLCTDDDGTRRKSWTTYWSWKISYNFTTGKSCDFFSIVFGPEMNIAIEFIDFCVCSKEFSAHRLWFIGSICNYCHSSADQQRRFEWSYPYYTNGGFVAGYVQMFIQLNSCISIHNALLTFNL